MYVCVCPLVNVLAIGVFLFLFETFYNCFLLVFRYIFLLFYFENFIIEKVIGALHKLLGKVLLCNYMQHCHKNGQKLHKLWKYDTKSGSLNVQRSTMGMTRVTCTVHVFCVNCQWQEAKF